MFLRILSTKDFWCLFFAARACIFCLNTQAYESLSETTNRTRRWNVYTEMSRAKNVYGINRFLILKITGCVASTANACFVSIILYFWTKASVLRIFSQTGSQARANYGSRRIPTRFLSPARKKNVSRAFTISERRQYWSGFKLGFQVSFTCLNIPQGMKFIYDNLSLRNEYVTVWNIITSSRYFFSHWK